MIPARVYADGLIDTRKSRVVYNRLPEYRLLKMNIFKPRAMKTVKRWSAGGVVARENGDRRIEIALVGRLDDNLWALPKGTPDREESIEETAIREVQEETGLNVKLLSTVDSTHYSFIRSKNNRRVSARENPHANVKVNKTVYWFLMEADGGSFERHDHEYDVACWVDLEKAINQLTYHSEAKIARSAARVYRKMHSVQDAVRIKGRIATIRSKRISDAWNEYVWRSDPKLAALDAAAPLNLKYMDFERFFREEVTKGKRRSLRFSIEDENGTHIGNCMCYDYDEMLKQAEFGIMIGDTEYWGRGYGTDAVKSLLEYVFTNTDIRRVYLHTLSSNRRAQRAFENAGFRKYSHVWREGKSFIQMEILSREWHVANS